MGFQGIAIAQCLQFISRFLTSLTFMKVTKNHKIRDYNQEPFFSRLTFHNLWYQLNICFHQMMMGIWPLWGIEIYTMMAGIISQNALAAMQTMRATSMLIFFVPMGVRMST